MSLKGLGSAALSAASTLNTLATAANNAAPAIQKAATAMDRFKLAVQDLQFGSGARATTGPVQQTAGQEAEKSAGLNKLLNLQREIESTFGPNNQIASIIRAAIPRIKAGDQDVGGFMKVLQGLLSTSFSGLQQEALSNDPAIRALALELEMISQSGRL